jgi:ParB-like nuclease family protein
MSGILNKMTIQNIPVNRLSVIWVQSQRSYDEKWAKHIADNFDPDLFDPLIVTKPNGEGIYHIVEGQHRRHALEMFAAKMNKRGEDPGLELAPCRVIEDADPVRAAQIWIRVNKGRKGIRPVPEFRIAVQAEQEPEMSINRIVTRCGYKVSDDRSMDNAMSAVAALKSVYNRHDASTLKHTLDALRLCWKADPQGVQGNLIRGFGIFLHEFGSHVDAKRLQKLVGEKFSPHQFLAAAKARRENTQETVEEAIAENLIREYNRGLREDLKLKRKS